jgi:hypothetical protein
MNTKRFNTFFKRWVQFRVGAIPRLPQKLRIRILKKAKFDNVYSKCCHIVQHLLI